MNLPKTQMDALSSAARGIYPAIQSLREYGLSKEAEAVNGLREAAEKLLARLIQIAEDELAVSDGVMKTQSDVMNALEEYGLIFREKIYLSFLKKVDSLTLKGGCYDLAFSAAVDEIKSLGDPRVFHFLNDLDVNVKYRRGSLSEGIKNLMPHSDWSNIKIWYEISKFADYKKSASNGIEYATFFGHPVTPVNYLR